LLCKIPFSVWRWCLLCSSVAVIFRLRDELKWIFCRLEIQHQTSIFVSMLCWAVVCKIVGVAWLLSGLLWPCVTCWGNAGWKILFNYWLVTKSPFSF
jgi:hypothetical protein